MPTEGVGGGIIFRMTLTTTRRRLPNRRSSTTHDLVVEGRRFSVSVGFYPDGRPGEVFLNGSKPGSQEDAILSDAAILASLALQHGTAPATLAKTMSRRPSSSGSGTKHPASPIGAAMDLLVV